MDNRAEVKIEFTIYGQTFRTDMSINWCPDEDGVDRRVVEFFDQSYDAAMTVWDGHIE